MRIVGGSVAVYCVAWEQPSGSSLVVNNCMVDVHITLDRTFTLVLVPF